MAESAAAVLTVDADAERLADIRAFIRRVAAEAGATDEATADLVQAVDELACNVITHGYVGATGPIEVVADAKDAVIRIQIRDEAPAFDPTTVPEPRLDLPLSQRPFGGMGIHLARALTDGFDHRILPSGGNEVTLTKRLRPTEPEEGHDGHHDRAPDR
jgi:serine/threonine-protein kinase RsbW